MLFAPGIRHRSGEPCPVVSFAYRTFGPELGAALLFEFTCFPMSDEHAMAQLLDLEGAQQMGRLGTFLRLQQHVQERETRQAAAA